MNTTGKALAVIGVLLCMIGSVLGLIQMSAEGPSTPIWLTWGLWALGGITILLGMALGRSDQKVRRGS
jgi:hypothetical protein